MVIRGFGGIHSNSFVFYRTCEIVDCIGKRNHLLKSRHLGIRYTFLGCKILAKAMKSFCLNDDPVSLLGR